MSTPYPHFGLRQPYTIAVYSPEGRLPKILRDCIGDDVAMVPVPPADWTGTDIYISSTGLSARAERAAAVLGAAIAVLPEATGWLHNRIALSPYPLRLFVATRQGDRPAPRFAERTSA